jgi:hypothetical protein
MLLNDANRRRRFDSLALHVESICAGAREGRHAVAVEPFKTDSTIPVIRAIMLAGVAKWKIDNR